LRTTTMFTVPINATTGRKSDIESRNFAIQVAALLRRVGDLVL
jgi:hypothetical protein